jgi:hypothetical protein
MTAAIGQWGRKRRNQLAFLTILRGVSAYNARASVIRTVTALIGLTLVLSSSQALGASLLVLIALSGPLLNYAMALYYRGRWSGSSLLRLIARAAERTDGKHQLNAQAYLEVVGLCSFVTAFSWVATDLGQVQRLVGLLAAMLYTTSVADGIYGDHTWFNPAEANPPWWHELLRLLAGPSTALLVAAIALPARWADSDRLTTVVMVALPLLVSLRLWDLDETLGTIDGVVENEQAHGRLLVRNETEAALAPTLNALVGYSRAHRNEAPLLYELALLAQGRLCEALALVDKPSARSTALDQTIGPLLTMARALGVTTNVQLAAGILTSTDADTASWVLRDLVGNALNANPTRIDIVTAGAEVAIQISIADDGHPMPLGVWKTPGTSSARLESHLKSLSGSLEMCERELGKVVIARWLAGHDEGRLGREPNDVGAGAPSRRRSRRESQL